MKKTLNTEWNLGLLYKNHKDPQIEKDVKAIEKAYTDFAQKYSGKDFTSDEKVLLSALKDYENLIVTIGGAKPTFYFDLARAINSEDSVAESQLTKIGDRFTKAGNQIIFFDLALGKIPEDKQEKILESEAFSRYRYFLSRIFLTAKYNLSEAEEKILSLKSQTSREMWASGVEKFLAKQTVVWKKKEIPVPKANSMLGTLPTKERRALSGLINKKMIEASDFVESEINAIYTDKKINDELRGLPMPYSSRMLSDEMDEKTVITLVKTITDSFAISGRFYKLKAKMLGLPKLEYCDRNAGVGKTTKKISFDSARDIVRAAFARMDQKFADIFDEYISAGQIDVFPKKGKRGGAFCAGNKPLPTFIMLNHIEDMNSAMTLAHELGHGIHTELSGNQPVFYKGYSTAVAEVASTFFEEVVFNDIFETLSPAEKIIALHDHIADSTQTVFRQIACFNFEYDLHKAVREKGFVQKTEMAEMMNKHMSSYLGSAFKMKPEDGYFFVGWPHLRYSFYVYSYAFGDIVSKALYARYKKDPRFIEKIKEFLSAGSSKSPYQIFKDIGIDISDPAFFQDGLNKINSDIEVLEKLIKAKNKK